MRKIVDKEIIDEALYWGAYQVRIIKKYSLCNLVKIVLIDTNKQIVVDQDAILSHKEKSIRLLRR
ncbi:hypothetical protein WAA20_06190 [Butyrivibrio fibrisolvens]|uniref:hypothetical protein n=1 Tax=Butyrivibrio fibrisolvens TaxID=831 RepID=UPI001114C1ED|nr:hypothetical protein [Butyrivibrio fibrisolvens]